MAKLTLLILFTTCTSPAFAQVPLNRADSVGSTGGTPFEDKLAGGLLVGLNLWKGDYAGHVVIGAVQPIFQINEETKLGQIHGKGTDNAPTSIQAKPGYAVGGLVAKTGDRIDMVKVVFMKRTPAGLNVSDSYESEWFGGSNESAERYVGGKGVLVSGLYGANTGNLVRLGLIAENKATEANTSTTIPVAPQASAVLHSFEDVLAVAGTSKPLKTSSGADFTAIKETVKSLNALKGQEVELEVRLEKVGRRLDETRYLWELVPATVGVNTFRPVVAAFIPADLAPVALQLAPGKVGLVRGAIRSLTVTDAGGLMLYCELKVSAVSIVDHRTVASGNTQPSASSVTTPATPVAGVNSGAQKGLQLDKGWNTPMQGGTATLNDLGRLFGAVAKPNIDLSPSTDTLLYQGITYLMPARQAIESLKLNVRLPSKVLIACAGLPRDSLYYYAMDGHFDGPYNRLYLVVDRADQVVAVELVDETPKKAVSHGKADPSWHTYDFVNARSKALNTLRVDHRIALWTTTSFEESHRSDAIAPEITAQNTNWKVARVDSSLVETDRFGYPTNAKQQTRWYVPRQIVELILTCVQKAGK